MGNWRPYRQCRSEFVSNHGVPSNQQPGDRSLTSASCADQKRQRTDALQSACGAKEGRGNAFARSALECDGLTPLSRSVACGNQWPPLRNRTRARTVHSQFPNGIAPTHDLTRAVASLQPVSLQAMIPNIQEISG